MPYLSIIIPAHNEEMRLPEALEKIEAFLRGQAYPAEVVVVENGSSDRTLEIAREFAQKLPNLVVIHEEGRGKGLAVQRGMLAAQGEYRIFCDVDLSMPIEQVVRFIPPQLTGADIAIASREAPGAVRYGEPPYRHFIGRVFNNLVRFLVLPGLNDTQCGFKCFRGAVADEIFPLQTFNGWIFDVEMLFIARQRGYQVVEVPIDWYYGVESKIRVLHDSVQMGIDLMHIRWNGLTGKYKK